MMSSVGESEQLAIPPPLNISIQSPGYATKPRETFEPVRLHFAINHDDFEEAKKEIGRVRDLNFVIHGNTPLMLALLREQYDIALALIYAGADVTISETYPWKRQPIHIAARNGNAEVVEALLNHGAHVQAADGSEMTALHWASSSGSLDVIEILLDHGAHVEARDDRGRTALFRAVAGNHYDVVEALRENGASVNTQDVYRWSPLHQAVLCSLPIAKKLLDFGANPNLQNSQANTALHMIVSRQNSHNLLVLSKTDLQFYTRDRKITSSYSHTEFISDNDLMYLLLSYQADVNLLNAAGQYPLDLALDMGHLGLIKWLIGNMAQLTIPAGGFSAEWPGSHMSDPDLCYRLRDVAVVKVQPLKTLVKACIRKSLLPPVDICVEKLPIPNELQQYLMISRPF